MLDLKEFEPTDTFFTNLKFPLEDLERLFDEKEEGMSGIWFEPWIGGKYESGGIFGKKILVVGHNHYCPYRNSPCARCGIDGGGFDRDEAGNPCARFTVSAVEDQPRAHRNFARAMLGRDLAEGDYERVWNSLAFFNYLQTALPEGDKYNSAAYERFYAPSEEAFKSVLKRLRPQKVITWGGRVWDEMPDGLDLLGVTHPSAKVFSWKECRKEIAEFLA